MSGISPSMGRRLRRSSRRTKKATDETRTHDLRFTKASLCFPNTQGDNEIQQPLAASGSPLAQNSVSALELWSQLTDEERATIIEVLGIRDMDGTD